MFSLISSSVVQLCLTLCDRMDHSPPGSSVHGTIPARILDQVAISSSKRSSRSKEQTCWLGFRAASALAGGFFITEPPGKPLSLMWSHLFCLFACDFDFILSLAQPMSFLLFFSEKKINLIYQMPLYKYNILYLPIFLPLPASFLCYNVAV